MSWSPWTALIGATSAAGVVVYKSIQNKKRYIYKKTQQQGALAATMLSDWAPVPGEISVRDFRTSAPDDLKDEDTIRGLQSPTRIRRPVRIITWNIERGAKLKEIISELKAANADIILLSEVDVDCDRSGNVDVGAEIAEALNMQIIFASEMRKVNTVDENKKHAHNATLLADDFGREGEDPEGTEGNAILTRFDILDAYPLVLPCVRNKYQPRHDHRKKHTCPVAVVATPSGPIACYSVHLDAFAGRAERSRQYKIIEADAIQYLAGPSLSDEEFQPGAYPAAPAASAASPMSPPRTPRPSFLSPNHHPNPVHAPQPVHQHQQQHQQQQQQHQQQQQDDADAPDAVPLSPRNRSPRPSPNHLSVPRPSPLMPLLTPSRYQQQVQQLYVNEQKEGVPSIGGPEGEVEEEGKGSVQPRLSLGRIPVVIGGDLNTHNHGLARFVRKISGDDPYRFSNWNQSEATWWQKHIFKDGELQDPFDKELDVTMVQKRLGVTVFKGKLDWILLPPNLLRVARKFVSPSTSSDHYFLCVDVTPVRPVGKAPPAIPVSPSGSFSPPLHSPLPVVSSPSPLPVIYHNHYPQPEPLSPAPVPSPSPSPSPLVAHQQHDRSHNHDHSNQHRRGRSAVFEPDMPVRVLNFNR